MKEKVKKSNKKKFDIKNYPNLFLSNDEANNIKNNISIQKYGFFKKKEALEKVNFFQINK